jgi:aminopeptidase N
VAAQFDRAFSRPASSDFWKLNVSDPGYPSMFDSPIYYRGAMALHALRLTVGDRPFWRIMRAWPRIHEGGNAGTGDFKRLAERVSDQQLDRLFRQWLVEGDKPADPR